MKIKVNGKAIEVMEGTTVGSVPALAGISPEGIAIAVENKVIRKADWDTAELNDGDRVTVIKAVCGG